IEEKLVQKYLSENKEQEEKQVRKSVRSQLVNALIESYTQMAAYKSQKYKELASVLSLSIALPNSVSFFVFFFLLLFDQYKELDKFVLPYLQKYSINLFDEHAKSDVITLFEKIVEKMNAIGTELTCF
ncbi:hypothetical protein RFI_39615, partial [Reticulomyxa filosa]